MQTAAQGVPGPADCQAWRDQHGQQDVITLYDPTGATNVLWEENYTALNVILDDQVISQKLHSDVQGSITAAIDGALD